MSERKEGTLRLLTPGEMGLARTIYGSSIIYNKVWIHCDSYLPFGLQRRDTGMTPNGEIYFRKETYSDDFSKEKYDRQHFFIHEMAHVWQHQKGMWVKLRGIVSWAADYSYDLDNNRKLNNYSLEQQAQIIADYFLLTKFGRSIWVGERSPQRCVTYIGLPDDNIRSKYETTLADFFRQR